MSEGLDKSEDVHAGTQPGQDQRGRGVLRGVKVKPHPHHHEQQEEGQEHLHDDVTPKVRRAQLPDTGHEGL